MYDFIYLHTLNNWKLNSSLPEKYHAKGINAFLNASAKHAWDDRIFPVIIDWTIIGLPVIASSFL